MGKFMVSRKFLLAEDIFELVVVEQLVVEEGRRMRWPSWMESLEGAIRSARYLGRG